jgi:MFS family permease
VAGLASPAFVLLVTATFAVFSAVGAIIPVLPRYVTGPLDSGGAGVGLVVGAFFVAALCSRPLAGRLGDERGRRLVIVGGAAVMAVSVAAFPLAPNVVALAVLRLVQGAGEAAFYVGVASAVTDLVPAARRGEAISYFSAALYGGLALGPVMGEAVLHHGGYGWVWTTAAALAAVAAGAGVVLREAPRSRPVAAETRARLLHPAALVPGSAFGLATFGYAAFAAFMPLYARSLGLSGSGAVFGCYAGLTLAGRLLGARLPDRLGAARTARAGMVLMAAGMAVMGTWQSPAGLWAGTVVFAAGNAFLFPALLSLTLAAAPERERGAVVGTVIAFFDIGQGAGALLLGPLAGAAGYPALFLTGAAAAVAGLAVLSSYLRRAPEAAPGDFATAA